MSPFLIQSAQAVQPEFKDFSVQQRNEYITQAAKEGNVERVREFIQVFRNTPHLLVPVSPGPARVARRLDFGNPGALHFSYTPLHWAIANGHTNVAGLLIEALKEHPELMMYAQPQSAHAQPVLSGEESNLYQKTISQLSTLQLALEKNQLESAFLITQALRTYPEYFTFYFKNSGLTPLHLAALKDKSGVILAEMIASFENSPELWDFPKKQIQYVLSVSKPLRGIPNWTPLHYAVEAGYIRNIQVLFNAGLKSDPAALLDDVHYDWKGVFYKAVGFRSSEVLDLLVQNFLKAYQKVYSDPIQAKREFDHFFRGPVNAKGHTLLDRAKEMNNRTIIEYLEQQFAPSF